MPAFKITYFFESMQQADKGAGAAIGWTESWYTPDITATVDKVIEDDDITQYVTRRTRILPSIYRISFVRVSDDNSGKSVVKLKTVNDSLGKGRLGYLSDTLHAQVQCAVLVDLVKLSTDPAREPNHHRRFLLRGLPDSVINGNVLAVANGDWIGIMEFFDWIARHETGVPLPRGVVLVGTKLHGCRYYDKTANPVPLDSVSSAQGSRMITNVNPAPPGLGAQKRFKIYGLRGDYRRFNRTWLATGPIPFSAPFTGGVRSRPWDSALSVTGGVQGGNLRALVFNYALFDQYTVIGLRSKRTGRIFRQLRGRSSSRRD